MGTTASQCGSRRSFATTTVGRGGRVSRRRTTSSGRMWSANVKQGTEASSPEKGTGQHEPQTRRLDALIIQTSLALANSAHSFEQSKPGHHVVNSSFEPSVTMRNVRTSARHLNATLRLSCGHRAMVTLGGKYLSWTFCCTFKKIV